jgi:hypothetical protein
MRKSAGIAAVALAVSGLAGAGAGASAAPAPEAQSSAVIRQFEGTVVSVNRSANTFRLRDTQRGVVRVKVNRRTRFERVNGLRGLRRGQSGIETTVRRSNGAWVAIEVERSGGGGRHGGDD